MITRKIISRTYSELIKIKKFEERFTYLLLDGYVGDMTFGGHRPLNQSFYHCQEWKKVRREIIYRDNGCDLGHELYPIKGRIYIHHLNPITIEDILNRDPILFDKENLICVSFETHNALHYGTKETLPKKDFETRRPNDTCPWR